MKTVAFAAICLLIGCTISAQDDGLPELRPEVMTSYAADFTDDRKLVGAAHNIFVGRVLTKIKMVRHNGRLHTRFEVAIVSNIKGDLQGSIFVDQLSGPRRKYGDVPGGPFWRRLRCSSVTDRCGYAPSSRLASTKNSSPLTSPYLRLEPLSRDPTGRTRFPGDDEIQPLEEGSTYAFATRSPAVNPEQIFRLNSHPNGLSLLTNDAKLSAQQLKTFVEAHPRVLALKEAYKNEIIPPAFQRDARNQYRSEESTTKK